MAWLLLNPAYLIADLFILGAFKTLTTDLDFQDRHFDKFIFYVDTTAEDVHLLGTHFRTG